MFVQIKKYIHVYFLLLAGGSSSGGLEGRFGWLGGLFPPGEEGEGRGDMRGDRRNSARGGAGERERERGRV